MQRDTNRSRFTVVEGEFQVRGLSPDIAFVDLARYTRQIARRAWLRKQLPTDVQLELDADRNWVNDACVPRDWGGSVRTILIAPVSCTKLAVLHSLAHIIAPATVDATGRRGIWHDMDFVKAYLELVRRYHNDQIDDVFKKEFKQALMKQGVKTKVVSEATKEKQRAAWINRSVPSREDLLRSIQELEEM